MFETTKDKIKEIVDIIAEEIQRIVFEGVEENYAETYRKNLAYIDDEKFPTKPSVRCQINMNDYLSFGKIFYLSKKDKKNLRNTVNAFGIKKVAGKIFNKNGEMYVTVLGDVAKGSIPSLAYFKDKFLIEEKESNEE